MEIYKLNKSTNFRVHWDETSGNLSQVAGQAVVVVKESLPQAPLEKTTQSVSSTRASSSKRQWVDGSSDGDVEATPPPYKEGRPSQ